MGGTGAAGAADRAGGAASGSVRGGVDVLLATSDHFGHGVFALVQRVLNQIHLARSHGLEPAVFLGERTFMEPQACEYGINPYYHAPAGDNVWEYWFEQPGNYSLGAIAVRGRPISSIQITTVEASAERPIRSYGPNRVRELSRATAHRLLGDGGEKLVKRWIRDEATRTFAPWRVRSKHILGVHLRGTDKAVRAKVPPEAYFPLIDGWLDAHQDGLVFVATDDHMYAHRLDIRYGFDDCTVDDGSDASGTGGCGGAGLSTRGRRGGRPRLLSRGRGYADVSWGGLADATRARRTPSALGMQKGFEVLLDALLLSKCDFILISASAVSEFALWVAPHLWSHHIDLQATDRLRTQAMPLWTRHVPGVAEALKRGVAGGRRRAVGDAFCAALTAACANETSRFYAGRYCSTCVEASGGPSVTQTGHADPL